MLLEDPFPVCQESLLRQGRGQSLEQRRGVAGQGSEDSWGQLPGSPGRVWARRGRKLRGAAPPPEPRGEGGLSPPAAGPFQTVSEHPQPARPQETSSLTHINCPTQSPLTPQWEGQGRAPAAADLAETCWASLPPNGPPWEKTPEYSPRRWAQTEASFPIPRKAQR